MTCRDLIIDALGELRVYAAGETPSIEDMTLGLTRLQRVSDIYLKDASPVLTLESDVPGPDEEAFLYELVFRLSGPVGSSMTPEQIDTRRRSKSRLLAILNIPADAEIEPGLLYLPSTYYNHGGNFNTGSI